MFARQPNGPARPLRVLLLTVIMAMLTGALPTAVAAASSSLLDSQRLWVSSQALDGAHDYSGVVNGNLDCQQDAPSTLDLTLSGNAYGESDGTFTQTISAEIDGRTVTRFDVAFEISLDGPDGPTTITGSAQLQGDPGGQCRIFPLTFADLYFLAAGTPGDSGLLLEYTAIVENGGVQDEVSGFVGASVLLQCYSAEVYQDVELFSDGAERSHCPDAESTLTFGMDAPPPPDPPYVPPAPFMVVSNAIGGPVGSMEGTTSGSFGCGTQSLLDMEVAGNAYGPYPGTFTESVHVVLQGDVVQAFDVEFTILSGDTTVSGTAQYLGGTATGQCGLSDNVDDGPAYEFRTNAQVRYVATIETPEGTSQVDGWAGAGVSLYCLGSTQFTQNCESATSSLVWLVPAVVGEDGEAATGDSVDEDNPAAVAVSNPAGGTIEITPFYGSGSTSSYIVLGQGYLIEASNPATANDPIQITFMLHSSQLYDYENDQPIDPASVVVLRNGQVAPACASSIVADPDACLYSRTVDGDGNLTLVILTSHASLWSIVASLGPPTADAIAEAVEALPASAFKANGHRQSMTSRLLAVQEKLEAGDDRGAAKQLTNLRRQVDGCGSKADKDDWIVGCDAQVEIRGLIDVLIGHLGG